MALPSSWPYWDVHSVTGSASRDEIIADARRQFGNAMYGTMPRSFSTGADVVRLENAIGKAEVTRILSGTSDRKSKAWKSAQRSQQRYRSGQRGTSGIPADRAAALQAAARNHARSAFLGTSALKVGISVVWTISSTTKPAYPHAVLTGEHLASFKVAVLGGHAVRAVQIVTHAWGMDPQEVIALHAVNRVQIG